MSIYINEERQQFHLTNGQISYIFHVMKNGQLGHLYYGRALTDREDFTHFQTYENTVPYTTHTFADDADFSLETVKQEFPFMEKETSGRPLFKLKTINKSKYLIFLSRDMK